MRELPVIRTTSALATAALLAAVLGGCGVSTSHPAKPKPKHTKASVLFSQTADSGTITPAGHGRQTLTLHGVEEQTTWFMDRPGRGAGQTGTDDFVSAWHRLGFTKDAPNAALTLLDAADKEDTLIVELEGQPRYDPAHSTLRYTVRVLHDKPAVAGLRGDQSIPHHFNDASLFIDDVIVGVSGTASGGDIVVVVGVPQDHAAGIVDAGSVDLATNPHMSFDRNGNICQINRCANAGR